MRLFKSSKLISGNPAFFRSLAAASSAATSWASSCDISSSSSDGSPPASFHGRRKTMVPKENHLEDLMVDISNPFLLVFKTIEWASLVWQRGHWCPLLGCGHWCRSFPRTTLCGLHIGLRQILLRQWLWRRRLELDWQLRIEAFWGIVIQVGWLLFPLNFAVQLKRTPFPRLHEMNARHMLHKVKFHDIINV